MRIEDYHKLPEEVKARVEDILSRVPNITDEEEAFLNSMTPDQVNPCGECTLCCIAPAIEAKHTKAPLTAPKPAGQACEYCEAKGGCRVYESRPSICKGYMCFYALGLAPDRPDSTGICWTAQPMDEPIPGFPDAWAATGHTLDYTKTMEDPRNRAAIIAQLNMGAMVVIIRSPEMVAQFMSKDHNAPPQLTSPLYHRAVLIDENDPMRQAWVANDLPPSIIHLF
jgi:hypothetical protein